MRFRLKVSIPVQRGNAAAKAESSARSSNPFWKT
jgi:hypothetical protein